MKLHPTGLEYIQGTDEERERQRERESARERE